MVFPSGARRAVRTEPRWNETWVNEGTAGAPGWRNQAKPAPAARPIARAAAATNLGQRACSFGAGMVDCAKDFELLPERESRAKARSLADWKRCSGCFSRQR